MIPVTDAMLITDLGSFEAWLRLIRLPRLIWTIRPLAQEAVTCPLQALRSRNRKPRDKSHELNLAAASEPSLE